MIDCVAPVWVCSVSRFVHHLSCLVSKHQDETSDGAVHLLIQSMLKDYPPLYSQEMCGVTMFDLLIRWRCKAFLCGAANIPLWCLKLLQVPSGRRTVWNRDPEDGGPLVGFDRSRWDVCHVSSSRSLHTRAAKKQKCSSPRLPVFRSDSHQTRGAGVSKHHDRHRLWHVDAQVLMLYANVMSSWN